MIRHELELHPNYQIKTFKETCDGKIISLENYNDKGLLHGEQYSFSDKNTFEKFETYDNQVLTNKIIKENGAVRHEYKFDYKQISDKYYYNNGQLKQNKLLTVDNTLIHNYQYLPNGILYKCIDNRLNHEYELYLPDMKKYDNGVTTELTISNIKNYIPDFQQRIQNIKDAKYCKHLVAIHFLNTQHSEIIEQISWYQFRVKSINDGISSIVPFYNVIELFDTL